MSLTSITSPSQCIEIFKELKQEDSLDKYKRPLIFSSSNYYYEYPQRFTQQQTKEIFSFAVFRKSLPNNYFSKILEKCINEKTVFPVVLDEWFTPKNNNLLDKYINLLHDKKDYIKLNKFTKYKAEEIEQLFLKTNNPELEFIDIAVKINSKNVLAVKNKDYIMDFLASHNYKIVDIAKNIDFEIGNNQPLFEEPEVKKLIYERLINYFVKKSNVDSTELFKSEALDKEPDFVTFLKKFPKDYMQAFEEKNSEFFLKQLNKPIKVNITPYEYQASLAQYIYTEKTKLGLDVTHLLNNYFELITAPLTENVWGYNAQIDPLEFHLRKKNVDFILPLANYYENLKSEQKEMFIAGVFKAFSIHKKKEKLIFVCLDPIAYEKIQTFYNKTKGELTDNQQNIIEKIITKLKIENSLTKIDKKSTFKKI